MPKKPQGEVTAARSEAAYRRTSCLAALPSIDGGSTHAVCASHLVGHAVRFGQRFAHAKRVLAQRTIALQLQHNGTAVRRLYGNCSCLFRRCCQGLILIG